MCVALWRLSPIMTFVAYRVSRSIYQLLTWWLLYKQLLITIILEITVHYCESDNDKSICHVYPLVFDNDSIVVIQMFL